MFRKMILATAVTAAFATNMAVAQQNDNRNDSYRYDNSQSNQQSYQSRDSQGGQYHQNGYHRYDDQRDRQRSHSGNRLGSKLIPVQNNPGQGPKKILGEKRFFGGGKKTLLV